MKHFKVAILLNLFAVLMMAACTTRSIVQRPDQPVALASQSAECAIVGSDTQWQAVWDMYRLWDADFSEYKFESGITYNYVLEDRWTDVLINATVGFLTTVTRHTVHLMKCDQQVLIRTPEDVNRQIEDALAKHLKDEGASRSMKRQPIFIMKDGTSYQGRIMQIDEKQLQIEIEEKDESSDASEAPDNTEDSDGEGSARKTVDRVKMKDGQVLEGHVVNQDVNKVVLRISEDGKTQNRTILKADIAQLKFGVSASETEEVQLKTISLDRSRIERITVPR
ncbi:MAG: hypothetical protein KDK25_01285 [Leptospiraceae bacterium]|nr:hypothetical protein [Leptospiraceae bacterium]